MKKRLLLTAVLLVMGMGWGICVPLTKIAVSTGYQPFGLIFWQLVIVVAVLGVVNWLRGKSIVFSYTHLRLFLAVAFCGALLPDLFFYAAAVKLPAGMLAILLASVPLFSLVIATLLGMDRISWQRGLGVSFGLLGIVLLIGPETALPDRTLVVWVMIALLAPLCYATEGNLVALWDTKDLDAVQILLGGSIIALVMSLPLALATEQWISPLVPFGEAEIALVASSVIHAAAYACYVWLVQHAGSVFAAQSSYLVNGFGIFWSMILLGELYGSYFWLAVVVMAAGLVLVQPKANRHSNTMALK